MSDQIIAIDLGTRSTKAVCMEKDGDSLRLVSYTIQDRPDFGKNLSREALSKHLLTVTETLNPKTKEAIFVVGAADALICHSEMPAIEPSAMRKMVKLNPRLYFQEDLPNHSFDCFLLHQEGAAKEGQAVTKGKTLIVAVKNQVIKGLQTAAESSGLEAVQIAASQTGSANCFLMSPEIWQKKVVALVDIGFAHSTISLLVNGEITLTRVVNLGADKLTAGIAEAMNITYSVAEGLKQIMPQKVHTQLKALVGPLAAELNNSIHFFEQKTDSKVSDIFFSGGSARSAYIVDLLQTELHVPCKSWDPTSSFKQKFTNAQATALQQEAPQLTVAIGAALTWFKPTLPAIDLLAEQKEEELMRSRDPMRFGYAIAASLAGLMILWYGLVMFGSFRAEKKLKNLNKSFAALQTNFASADADVKQEASVDGTLRALETHSSSRFLWAPVLNALQYAVVDNCQFVRIHMNQAYTETKAKPAVVGPNKQVNPAVKAETTRLTTLNIQAKSASKPSAADKLMSSMAQSPWFQANLRREEPIRLTENQAAQIDPSDPTKMTILFTVECYAERKL